MRFLKKYNNNKDTYSSGMEQISNDDIMPLLYKYMEGIASDDESEIIEEFLLFKGSNKQYFSQSINETLTNKLWLKLMNHLQFKNDILSNNQIIHMATEEDFKQYVYQNQSQRNQNNSVKLYKSKHITLFKYTATAAVVLIFFYLGWQNLNMQELLHTKTLTQFKNPDSVKRITLQDGSIVYLNKGSDMGIYKSSFNKEKREVWIHGEAYFEVSKNPNKPFIVHNGEFSAEVKGTAFNIKNYSQINKYVVSVTQGSVQVMKGKAPLGLLSKNNELVYNISTRSYQITEKNCDPSRGWIQGKLMLENVNIQELKLRLEQHFGVELIVNVDTSYFNHIQFSSPSLHKEAGVFDIMERFCTIYKLDFNMSKDGSKCYLSQ